MIKVAGLTVCAVAVLFTAFPTASLAGDEATANVSATLPVGDRNTVGANTSSTAPVPMTSPVTPVKVSPPAVFPKDLNGSQFGAELVAVLGPDSSQPGYSDWATATEASFYKNGGITNSLGNLLPVDSFYQPAIPTNLVVWFWPHVWSQSPFNLLGMGYQEIPAVKNTLENQVSLSSIAGIDYGPWTYGAAWAASSPGPNDQLFKNFESGSGMVNEVWGPPIRTVCFQPVTLSDVQQWLTQITPATGYPNGFGITMICTVTNSAGGVANGQLTLQINPRPTLKISSQGNKVLLTAINVASGKSVIVQSTTDLKSGVWATEGTMVGNQITLSTGPTRKFYRTVQ